MRDDLSEIVDQNSDPARRRARLVALGALLVIVSVISCVMRVNTPHWVVVYNVDDDQLYIRVAHGLLQGNWFGEFDSRLLEKPPGFGIFLALAHQIPLPFQLVQHLFLLSAAALAGWAVFRVSRRVGLAAFLYVVVALDPTFLGSAATRLIRDSWYSAQTLLVFVLVTLTIPVPGDEKVFARPTPRRLVVPALMGIFGGVAFTGYWIGRSEKPWMLPALGLVLLAAFILRNKATRDALPELPRKFRIWRALAPVAVPCVLALVVTQTSLSAIASKNEEAYGVQIVEDMYDGPFAEMYGNWQSVRAGSARRFVQINAAQRQAVYEISPAARELAPALENPDNIYLGFGCTFTEICDDHMAGWLLFALRAATVEAGRFESAPQAHEFWARIASDIASACDDGRLACSYPMPGLLPSPSHISLTAWAKSTYVAFDSLVNMVQADPTRPFSGTPSVPGDDVLYEMFRGSVRGLPDTLLELQGDEAAERDRWELLRFTADIYSWFLLIGGALAVVGYVGGVVRRQPGWARTWIIGMGAGLVVVLRLVLIGFVDSTTFPSAHAPNYIMPASTLAMIFVVCGVGLLWVVARDLLRERKAS